MGMDIKQKREWKRRLAKLKGYEETAKDAENLGGTVDDGKYLANVVDAYIGESQASGRDQIVVKTQITDHEEYEGQNISAFMGLEDKSLVFTLAALKRLGFELPEDPAEIVDIVEELAKSEMTINIKVKDGFANIQGKADGDDNSSDDDDDEDEDSDDNDEDDGKKRKKKSEISEGDKVEFVKKGKEIKGEVIEIDEDNETARVETEAGKIVEVDVNDLTIVEDSDSDDDDDDSDDEDEDEDDDDSDDDDSDDDEEDNDKKKDKKKKKKEKK